MLETAARAISQLVRWVRAADMKEPQKCVASLYQQVEFQVKLYTS